MIKTSNYILKGGHITEEVKQGGCKMTYLYLLFVLIITKTYIDPTLDPK